jgi:hypothetical protein
MAISYLPPSVSTKLELTLGELQEQRAPSIMETLLSHGIDVPPALELDGKGFYDFFKVGPRQVQTTSKAANALWSAEFYRFDEPNDDGWTPFLQSWFYHNFEMIDWFARRGVELDSKHTNAPLSALHLYAKGMRYFGKAPRPISPLEEHCIESIQKKLGIPYDDCTCICSPEGCIPSKFVFEFNYEGLYSQRREIQHFIKHLNPPKHLLSRYIYHLTQHILFDFLGGEHTCCSLGRDYVSMLKLRRPTRTNSWRKTSYGSIDFPGEHYQCCTNGLPVPRVESLRALQDPDVFSVTLDSAMSHYDEMDRPDTMPAEEQIYAYIKWILEEGYLDIDVSHGCEHDLNEDME